MQSEIEQDVLLKQAREKEEAEIWKAVEARKKLRETNTYKPREYVKIEMEEGKQPSQPVKPYGTCWTKEEVDQWLRDHPGKANQKIARTGYDPNCEHCKYDSMYSYLNSITARGRYCQHPTMLFQLAFPDKRTPEEIKAAEDKRKQDEIDQEQKKIEELQKQIRECNIRIANLRLTK